MRRNDFLSVTVSGGLRGACLKVAERRRKPQPAGTALERHEVGPFASRVFQCRPSEAKGRRSWYRRNSKGTRREFEFYLLKDWAFRGQASSRTRPVASPTRRLIQRGETSTCRRQPRQERSAPSTPQHLAPSAIKARVLGQAWRQFVVRGRVPNGRRRHRAHRLWAQTVHGRAQGVVRIPI